MPGSRVRRPRCFFQAVRRWDHLGLVEALTVSASALSDESPTLPTEVQCLLRPSVRYSECPAGARKSATEPIRCDPFASNATRPKASHSAAVAARFSFIKRDEPAGVRSRRFPWGFELKHGYTAPNGWASAGRATRAHNHRRFLVPAQPDDYIPDVRAPLFSSRQIEGEIRRANTERREGCADWIAIDLEEVIRTYLERAAASAHVCDNKRVHPELLSP